MSAETMPQMFSLYIFRLILELDYSPVWQSGFSPGLNIPLILCACQRQSMSTNPHGLSYRPSSVASVSNTTFYQRSEDQNFQFILYCSLVKELL